MAANRMVRVAIAVMLVLILVVSSACTTPTPAPTVAPTKAPAAPTAAPAAPTKAPAAPTAAPAAPTKAAVNWPTKDVTIIVPFSPGGGFDLQARIFAPLLQKYLPQKANVVVENQKGAGGKIGSIALMKSPATGYVMGILSPASLALMQANGELEGNDITKLGYVGMLSWEDGAVVVSAASGLKAPADLTKKELRFAVTSDSVFAASLLAKQVGIKARYVTFESTGEQALAMMRGDVDIMVDSVSTMKKSVDNGQGKLVGLFVVGEKRASTWADLPTSKELGLSLGDLQYIAGSARVIAVPAGVPADVLKAIVDATAKALADPQYKADIEKAGYTFGPGNAEATTTTVQKTMEVINNNKDVLKTMGQ